MTLTVGSLFAGIGGFDLGLERAGMRTRWFVECDPFCQKVLAKHWPDVPCYEDVCAVTGATLSPVDVLCGGFPCQDISDAGHRVGIGGSRSGLWLELARLVGELRPRYVIVENVAAIAARGLGVVLGDLAALGYDAEWEVLSACAFGAPHTRERMFILAYPNNGGQEAGGTRRNGDGDEMASGRARAEHVYAPSVFGRGKRVSAFAPEPDVGRVANGVPARVDRLRSLGNALVPQIAEWIGRRILEYEASVQPVAR